MLHRRWSLPVAFAAAWLLVLQSALGAFALGVGTASQLDAFGNVICTHQGAAEIPSGDPHQQHLPSCCVLGCGMSSHALGAPPETGSLLVSFSLESLAFAFRMPERLAFERERSPSSPRAPPTA